MRYLAILTSALFLLAPLPVIAGTVRIQNCYDGDTCTTTKGEKIRLACIDTPELRGKRADPIPAKSARDYIDEIYMGNLGSGFVGEILDNATR